MIWSSDRHRRRSDRRQQQRAMILTKRQIEVKLKMEGNMKTKLGLALCILVTTCLFAIPAAVAITPPSTTFLSPQQPGDRTYGAPCPGEEYIFTDDHAGWGTYYYTQMMTGTAEYFQYACTVESLETHTVEYNTGKLYFGSVWDCAYLHGPEYLDPPYGRESLYICTSNLGNRIWMGHLGDVYYDLDCYWRWALDCKARLPLAMRSY